MSSRRDSRRDGKNGSRTKYNAERVERWRKYAERRVIEVDTLPAYNSARLVAAKERKPLSELIVDILCRQRLMGKVVARLNGNPSLGRQNAFIDTLAEKIQSPKQLAKRDKNLVSFALSHISCNQLQIIDAITKREREVLMRRFYKNGDLSVHKAILRAVQFSLREEGVAQ